MKKQTIVALALLMGSFSFAQKNEIRDAEKAIKKSNFAEAKTAINSAESLIGSADDKMKAKFYLVKGQALYANGTGSSADMDAAIESLNKVEEVEGKDGKSAKDVQEIKQNMVSALLTKANASFEKNNFAESSKGFAKVYRLSPQDPIYLYYAAATAVNGEDYENALKYYEELKAMNYKGDDTVFTAVNKETMEEETFDSKNMRDISVKAGTHTTPSEKKETSKAGEIAKNITLIYMNLGENEKAVGAMKDARAANPDDATLIIAEANMELQMGNKEAFKKLIKEALQKDPNNAELLFNLGIVSAEAGENETAKEYYNKAIKIQPDYGDVYTNMAVLILDQEKEIIEEMNKLGSSAADNKKYDALKAERSKLYEEAIPYLETALKLKPTDIEAAKTLVNIYGALDKTNKLKEMKAKVEALENAQN